jgi:cyclopropane-fatty-acyl-phospholipid synthase
MDMQTGLAPSLQKLPTRRPISGAILRRLLSGLACGSLTLELPNGQKATHAAAVPGPDATLIVRRWRVARRLLLEGQIGFAESYIDGDWTTPDLAALIELAARNQDGLGDMLVGTWLQRLSVRLGHRKRANTKRGSRRNIRAHYDLGNDFYAAWLDRGMSYSSALFRSRCDTLETAQTAKQDRIIDLLDLRGGEHVLEIGCGWGGLAQRLILERGCRVTGLTLSPAQAGHARELLALSGAGEAADIRLQDYRDTKGQFDRIVSIEMLEAVGADYWPIYFARLRGCLAEGGRAVLQVITIAEKYYESYRRDPDFIQQHIFPGGMLPSIPALREQISGHGLRLVSAEHFGESYALTLAEWHRRFQLAWPDLRHLGFDDAFRRKWEYYLAYCEGGFRAGVIDVGLYQVMPNPG